jgi:hypothetical protein
MPCPELQRKPFGARTRVFIEPYIKAGRTAFLYVAGGIGFELMRERL